MKKLIHIPSITTLAYMVIYFEIILHVSASLGHHQEYLQTQEILEGRIITNTQF
jgi:hypothetical protein